MKKIIKFVSITPFILLLIQIGTSQSTFQNIFLNHTHFVNGVQTADKGFLGVGSFNSKEYIVKMDSDGYFMWSTKITDTNFLRPTKIITSGDKDEIFFMGHSNITNTGRLILSKFDTDGKFLNAKQYPNGATNIAFDMESDGENGVIMVGGGCNGSNYVIRCNNDLEIVWQRQFGSEYGGSATCITKLSSGNFIVGAYGLDNQNSNRYLVFEIDLDGSLIWSKSISGFANPDVIKILELRNGDLAVLCSANLISGSFLYDVILMRLTSNGSVLWSKAISSDGSEYFFDLIELENGEIMFGGQCQTANVGGGILGTISSEGVINFFKNITYENNNGTAYVAISSLIPVCEDKIAVIGGYDGAGIGFVNPDGDGLCHTELIPNTTFDISFNNHDYLDGNFSTKTIHFAANDYVFDTDNIQLQQNIQCNYTPPDHEACITSRTEEKIEDNLVKIMPNPSNLQFVLDFGELQNTPEYYQIFASNGNLIEKRLFKSAKIEIDNLPSGVYLLHLIFSDKILIKRFVKV